MAESVVLGLPLDADEDDQIAVITPLAAMVVVKGLDEEGNVVYCTGATDGLKSVECLGMARYAVLKLERGLARELDEDGDDLPDMRPDGRNRPRDPGSPPRLDLRPLRQLALARLGRLPGLRPAAPAAPATRRRDDLHAALRGRPVRNPGSRPVPPVP